MLRLRRGIGCVAGFALALLVFAGGEARAAAPVVVKENARLSEYDKKLDEELRKARDRYLAGMREIEKERIKMRREYERECEDVQKKIDDFIDSEKGNARNVPASGGASATAADDGGHSVMAALQDLQDRCIQGYINVENVLNARENLEENRYRDAQAALPTWVKLWEAKRAADRADKREARANELSFEERMMYRHDSYMNSRQTLDRLLDLAIKTAREDRKLQEKRLELLEDMAESGVSQDRMDRLRRDLADLGRRQQIEDQLFQINYRFLDERLAVEQYRIRQMARIEDYYDKIEKTFDDRMANFDKMREDLKARESEKGVSDEARKKLRADMDSIDERIKEERKAYGAAVFALTNRKEMINQEVGNRLQYLDERNRIRVSIAKDPARADGFFMRGRIEGLKDRRLAEEDQLRTNYMALDYDIPARYRIVPDAGVSLEAMQKQIDVAAEERADLLKHAWEDESAILQKDLAAVDQQLSAGGLGDDARQELGERKAAVQLRLDTLKSNYESAVKGLADRKDVELKRAQAMHEYLVNRDKIMQKINAGGLTPDEVGSLEIQVQNLDDDWQQKELQFGQELQPLRQLLFPVDPVDEGAVMESPIFS